MGIKIALAGNPNCGKTTLFNALTGSNQFVGNWPGVTVEKKEGKLKYDKEVTITDLPGIYSLSPYTLEEVVARNYLIDERPEAILNIVDGSNLERNLYLTTQLVELGIPVVLAINMMDIVKKNGDKINTSKLAEELGVDVFEISALKGQGIEEAAKKAVEVAKKANHVEPRHRFEGSVEHALAHIEELLLHNMPAEQQRWYAIKLFERDEKIIEKLKITDEQVKHIEQDIASCEKEMDDDAESIITSERYIYIGSIIDKCLKKNKKGSMTTSDKIDRIVTNRFLALPIFAVIMFIVYYISVTTVGTVATDWANDGVFGDGWYLCGIGRGDYNDDAEPYDEALALVEGYISGSADQGVDTADVEDAIDSEAEDYSGDNAVKALKEFAATAPDEVTYESEDEETLETTEEKASKSDLEDAIGVLEKYNGEAPDPADYGIWIPGIPVFIEAGLDKIGCADWLSGLILDGIVAGVGAVLGFVPQMLVLFIFLAFLEACGYMARIAFIMDRIFRKFGLSGKSFIPILIGTGCGVPGIMASRTIENEKDRRMTIMTTTFIPCGAKLPFIALMAGAIFGGAAWVAPCAYFIGIIAIICSGIILKKTKMFEGDPAPFVMELPAYHMPTVGNVLRSMWERGWSFIKKAGTIILLSTIVVWYLSYFGFVDGHYQMLAEDQMDMSILAAIGRGVAWIFAPLGWGNWQAAVGAVTGLVAKENIVATLGILYTTEDASAISNIATSFGASTCVAAGFSFLVFNLLCAPCFAAMGAIKREMNNGKWTAFAIAYQCIFAYLVALCIYNIGELVLAGTFHIGFIVAIIIIIAFLYLLFRPAKKKA